MAAAEIIGSSICTAARTLKTQLRVALPAKRSSCCKRTQTNLCTSNNALRWFQCMFKDEFALGTASYEWMARRRVLVDVASGNAADLSDTWATERLLQRLQVTEMRWLD